MVQPLCKTVCQFVTKLNIFLPYHPEITFLGTYSKELKSISMQNLHMDDYSSIINNCQNLEGAKMFFSKWVGKLWYTQTVEYYSVLKIYKLPNHKKTWRNLKYILLSERSQSEKVTYDVFQIIWCYRKDKTMETIKILVVSRA